MTAILLPFRTDLESSAARLRTMNSLGGSKANQADHIWDFDPNQPADSRPFPPDHRFKTKSGINLVAPFAPGRLMIWRRTDANGDGSLVQAGRRVIFTLDSNLFREVCAVLVDGCGSQADLLAVLELATHAGLYHAEQQPIGYIREMVLHSPVADTKAYAARAVEGLLRLHALDTRLTESAGSHVYNDDVVKGIQQRLKCDSLDDCAAKIIEKMYIESTPGVHGNILLFYATILKSIAVGMRKKAASLESKCAEIDDFVVNVLHAVQPRLFVLSRLFFHRQLSILSAQPGNSEFDRAKLVGSAYDVYLTTIHEEILGDSDPPEGTVSILCTRDLGLADYAGRFPLRSLAKMQDTSFRIYHEWDDEWIKNLLGEPAFRSLTQAIEAKLNTLETPRPPEDIREIIAALEDNLQVPAELRLLKDGKQIYIP